MRHLRLIDVLATTGNMHRAAAEINVSQPAATKSLQDLEEILGAVLFTRGVGGVAINEIGRYVLEYARRLLYETERFNEGLVSMKAGGAGVLSVGAVLSSAPFILPRAIARFKASQPLVRLKVTEDSSDRLLRALEQNQYELLLARFTEPRHTVLFNVHPVSAEPLSVFSSPKHPMFKRRQVGLQQLVDCPWIVQPPSSPTRQILDQAFASSVGRFPVDTVETSSILMTLHLVQQLDAVSILPTTIVSNYLATRQLRVFPLDLQADLPPFGIITKKDAVLSDNAKLFISAVREIIPA